ncbi:MAG: ABC transporter permease [Acutalibacteraceae bacterium]|jgi:putative ABC transport system permease protein
MNVFYRFTRRCLRQNRTRTLVTVIGIMLSMALTTAVVEGAYSGLQFLLRGEIEASGGWHGCYYGLTADGARMIAADGEIADSTVWQQVGWAEIDNQNDYKPYLLIESIGDQPSDLVAFHLQSGRMPQNAGEIVLPAHLGENGGAAYKVGDTLTLNVGRRMSDGYELPVDSAFAPQEEAIASPRPITYTVVGVCERMSSAIEPYECPGYMAFTAGGGSGRCMLFFSVRHPAGFYRFMEARSGSGDWFAHTDLLQLSGALRNNRIATTLYGFAAILICLIAFGSIALIYNSFSISVGERTRQFGILKSVGAAKKQIRGAVLYEALLLCAVGIPAGLLVGCAGIGITLWALRNAFASLLIYGGSTRMELVLNPTALIIAAAVCLITTMIAAWVPARRAMKVSAIDAIRQSKDIQIKSRSVKTSRLTQKLFGFEGTMAAKNFKRNRKRYRSTVLSLFLSVTLFISASSFCAYLTDSVESYTAGNSQRDVEFAMYADDADPDKVLSALSAADGVKQSMYVQTQEQWLTIAADMVSDAYKALPFSVFRTDGSGYEQYASLAFVNDAAFDRICRDNGIDPADYHRADAPRALLYNEITQDYFAENEPRQWYTARVLDESRIPAVLPAVYPRDYPGYRWIYYEEDPDGSRTDVYYPEDEIEAYWAGNGDESKFKKVPQTESALSTDLTVGALIREQPFALPKTAFVLLYPFSMKDAAAAHLPPDRSESRMISFAFTADDHARVYQQMKKTLEENGWSSGYLSDVAAYQEQERTLVTVVRVFAYGFIILISLIAAANVFNTISTNISLRRREFAMLKSIGLSDKGFGKMMRYECVIYGVKGLVWGLPASVLITYLIWRVTDASVRIGFYVPWTSVAIAVGSVFAVVFATMLYAAGKIKKDNPIDALKNENL